MRWTGSPACSNWRCVGGGTRLEEAVLWAALPTCSNCRQTFLGVASPFGRRRILDFYNPSPFSCKDATQTPFTLPPLPFTLHLLQVFVGNSLQPQQRWDCYLFLDISRRKYSWEWEDCLKLLLDVAALTNHRIEQSVR